MSCSATSETDYTVIGWAGGNAIAPQLFQAVWAPRYLNSLYIHLGLYGAFIATALATRLLLVRRNQNKEMRQEVNNNSHGEPLFIQLDLGTDGFKLSRTLPT